MAVFSMTKFNYRKALSANSIAGFNFPIINFNSNLVENFSKGFFKLIRDWNEYTLNLYTFSPRILSICPALPLHVKETILELAINIFCCSKAKSKLLKTFIKFTYLLSIFFCILSIIVINSCLISLLRDSSVKDAMYLNNKNDPSCKIKL